MTDGSHQTSVASDPLQRAIVNHDMASFKMTNGWEDLTRSYQPFTQTTVFSHSRLEHSGPFTKDVSHIPIAAHTAAKQTVI
jgi:hypothetical protein